VSACLEHDHLLLDALLIDVGAFAQTGNFQMAAEHFGHFRRQLATHIDAEETILFPTFERAGSCSCSGPTTVMRREHIEIRRLLDAVSGGLAARESTLVLLPRLQELTQLLESHNQKEERMLYPLMDAGARARGEMTDLVARVQAYLER
jgi:iron-sulfur cluster repair protein YtfE (RIC family)